MAKKRQLTDEEKKLWRHVTRDVTPMTASAAAAPEPEISAPTIRKYTQKKSLAPAKAPLSPPAKPGKWEPLERTMAAKLKRGEYPIDATLDLHGLTRDQAYGQLGGFFERARSRGQRCLLIVTGKGKGEVASPEERGILRGLLPRWLADEPFYAHVLAVTSAHRKHGGEGAYYVLLKRIRS